jgi:hypothetical protein
MFPRYRRTRRNRRARGAAAFRRRADFDPNDPFAGVEVPA